MGIKNIMPKATTIILRGPFCISEDDAGLLQIKEY